LSRFDTSDSRPLRAAGITWLLAQTFWVGGLWLLHFVVFPALEKVGLAPLLIDEIANGLRPLLVGFAAFCAVMQAVVLVLAQGARGIWRDTRSQLLLAVVLLAAGHLASSAGWMGSAYWQVFSYLAMAVCGLLLVLQPVPGREQR
jgi:hypothetical protein